MRSRSTRRRRPARTYSIAYLLAHQPKSLQKDDDYALMIAHFRTSESLRRLRVGRRCYNLLHNARIQPQHLHNFYRTYRVPADPFFPLFFSVKRKYLEERRHIKEERRRYILASVQTLPPPILQAIKYLGNLERHYNHSGRYPVWQKELFPNTKKRARECSRYSAGTWLALFRCHLTMLVGRYPRFTDPLADRTFACLVLEIVPQEIPPPRPPASLVNRSYRRLSLVHHPDRGGEQEMFVQIKKARDTLLARQ